MNTITFASIPIETAKAALAIFGRSNFYLAIGDQADHLFAGLILEDPPGRVQKPARTQAMLYLITIFQFVETLPDHLAVDAVRERVDWKYALHLPLNYPRQEVAALCEFRKGLVTDETIEQNFQTLLARLSEVTESAGKQLQNLRTHEIVASVCVFSQLAKIWEAINQALQTLATRRPDWLLETSLPHWYERYGHHHRTLNLMVNSQGQDDLAQAIGADGDYLLQAISNAGLCALADLPEVLVLEQVWREQFERKEGKVVWRKGACAGCPLQGRQNYSMKPVIHTH